ncbi:hypothetical protein NBE98_09550 [Clostridium swellfunianum]|uniref:hypothetical protein n=1 Tax=Clostridium swellfunianum TaxID=1367462 RepID=UPI00202F285D|nr:hypothetical protein [Clostridium swellfunianum]MCM0648617.1 hypothetical protein [Clostridium swellfunianum]
MKTNKITNHSVWNQGDDVTVFIKAKMDRVYSKYPIVGNYTYQIDERVLNPRIIELMKLSEEDEE